MDDGYAKTHSGRFAAGALRVEAGEGVLRAAFPHSWLKRQGFCLGGAGPMSRTLVASMVASGL